MSLTQYFYICLRPHTSCLIEKLFPKNLTQYSYICLKVLRDVTLYYNEQHPELRAAERGPIAEDDEADGTPMDGDNASTRTSTPEMPKNDESNESTKKA